jgi:hypothetical protein
MIGPICLRKRRPIRSRGRPISAKQNRIRLRPSSIEIAHMEEAICWPARCLREYPQLVRTVMVVAAGRAKRRDMGHASRRFGMLWVSI